VPDLIAELIDAEIRRFVQLADGSLLFADTVAAEVLRVSQLWDDDERTR
jgi:hypothetical protein